jgi:hypothetical protein
MDHIDVDVKIILEWILGKQDGWVWTGLTQDRDQWLALVNIVMNRRFL